MRVPHRGRVRVEFYQSEIQSSIRVRKECIQSSITRIIEIIWPDNLQHCATALIENYFQHILLQEYDHLTRRPQLSSRIIEASLTELWPIPHLHNLHTESQSRRQSSREQASMNYTRDCQHSVTVLLTVKTVKTVGSVRVEFYQSEIQSKERVLCDQLCESECQVITVMRPLAFASADSLALIYRAQQEFFQRVSE